jgi:hypothetical protein
MTDRISVLERRANRIVEAMNGQAKIVTEPDHEGYVRVEIEVRHAADLLFLYHAGIQCGMDLAAECDERLRAA